MNIFDALREIGYRHHVEPRGTDQQIRCPFHKGGNERSPSARLYESTDSIHCFSCGKSWNAIALLAEHEGVEYRQALEIARERYGPSTAPTRRQRTLAHELADTANALRRLNERDIYRIFLSDVIDRHAAGDAAFEVEARLREFRNRYFADLLTISFVDGRP